MEAYAYRRRIEAAEIHLSAAISRGSQTSARLAIGEAQSAWQHSNSAQQRGWCAEIIRDAETILKG